jgi:hypothetical protein
MELNEKSVYKIGFKSSSLCEAQDATVLSKEGIISKYKGSKYNDDMAVFNLIDNKL